MEEKAKHDKHKWRTPNPRALIVSPEYYLVQINGEVMPLDTVIKEYQEQLEALAQIMKWQTGVGHE